MIISCISTFVHALYVYKLKLINSLSIRIFGLLTGLGGNIHKRDNASIYSSEPMNCATFPNYTANQ